MTKHLGCLGMERASEKGNCLASWVREDMAESRHFVCCLRWKGRPSTNARIWSRLGSGIWKPAIFTHPVEHVLDGNVMISFPLNQLPNALECIKELKNTLSLSQQLITSSDFAPDGAVTPSQGSLQVVGAKYNRYYRIFPLLSNLNSAPQMKPYKRREGNRSWVQRFALAAARVFGEWLKVGSNCEVARRLSFLGLIC